jgi:F0F1-type ATP synthase gamma subunit
LASGIASEVMTAYKAKEYDAIVFIYNHYVNPAVYQQYYKVIRELPKKVKRANH